jgi:hypothetical protein
VGCCAACVAPARRLTVVPHGLAYRVASPPAHAPVTPALACELRRVLERFAVEAGFSAQLPVLVGFAPGIVGHHRIGRAADIYEVGGVALNRWKERWDDALVRASRARGATRAAISVAERKTNLGWRLYMALKDYGRWSQPYGYPIQLFGPWTRSEGPWKHISDSLLRAHHDHVHVAK